MLRRIQYIFLFVVAVFIFLIYRLYNLQVVDNKEMLQKVASQHLISVPVNNIRGTIFDKNLIPLTDNSDKTILIIIPQLVEDYEHVANMLTKNCKEQYNSVLDKLNKKIPFEYNISPETEAYIKNNLVDGVVITKTNSRYGDNTIARHLIGYLNSDYIGQSGIEKSYNSYLSTGGSQLVGVISDAIRRPLVGYGYRAVEINNKDGVQNIKLTIDSHFQKLIENEFDKYSYSGAAILLDVKTFDVLAMVSRPDFDQNDVSKYFNSSNKELINKSLYPYSLGSIFKIIVANAGLENGVVDENSTFFCPGFIDVDGQIKKCSSFYSGGHGLIDLKEAFAKSCNTAFIEIGLRVGHNKIIESAQKFGFGSSVGLAKHGLVENPGLAQMKKYISRRETANISIGQGEILVTPIQVGNMINIIANSGIQKKINIVDSIVDEDGFVIENIRETDEKRVMDQENNKIIMEMMKEVAESGTGKSANVYEYGGVSGKTSSAETGSYNEDGQIIHAWFGGYFPNDNPKYTLVVVIEDGKSGSVTAAPLFGEISRKIMRISK